VWRHGDRLPTETYPNDPLQEPQWIALPDKGFQGFGQLTTVSSTKILIIDVLHTFRKEWHNIL
jgi:hypothetical protein